MKRVVAIVVLALGFGMNAGACLWDYDTLAMERQRFPSVAELIAGKFLRHSPEYYQWRIEDRIAKLSTLGPDAPLEEVLPLRDDLAVAYDKLGRHEEAIATGKATLALDPGRYESVANQGTFYIHAGRLEKGLALIKRAIAINPDAHFGREKYQQYLVEYVLFRRAEGDGSLPLRRAASSTSIQSFSDFVAAREAGLAPDELLTASSVKVASLTSDQQRTALKGVAGMMRFGNYQSPILLEALGDLMTIRTTDERHSARLAARAYFRAGAALGLEWKGRYAYANDPMLHKIYLPSGEFRQVQERLEAELTEAKAWQEEVANNEARWIREGVNVDAAFAETYYAEPELRLPLDEVLREIARLQAEYVANMRTHAVILGAIALLGAPIGIMAGWRMVRALATRRTRDKDLVAH